MQSLRHPLILRVRSLGGPKENENGNEGNQRRPEVARCGPEDMKFAIKSGKNLGLSKVQLESAS